MKIVKWALISGMMIMMGSCANKKENKVYPAVHGLIQRVAPSMAKHVIVDSIPPENGKDVFEIYRQGKKIVFAGSSPVAAASAFNWYLKYFCHCHAGRAGHNLQLPEKLPEVKEKIRKVSPYRYRYWLNYCTFNYTMSFWTWEEWEKELDWMAMNGINLALVIIGTEKTWQKTLQHFNFSEKEILDFIPGPAYQAWWLMENLEGWGGPVSQAFIERQAALASKILERMREYGMQPLFQGFYGMVPYALKEKYPAHRILDAGEWCAYRRPAFLMPDDSLFDEMAKVFYEEQRKLYGEASFFGGDPFHEGGRAEAVDLTLCGKRIQQAMQQSHPGSTWVLQGWLGNPSPKLLAGLDPEKTLVLDLFGETLADWNKYQPSWKLSEGYHGMRWIWCTVTNFGGRNGLHGKIDSTTLMLREARNSTYGKRLEGIGIMPEGSHVNPFMFDYLAELAWHDDLPVPEKWAEQYSVFRYGKDLREARQAWHILSRTVYNIPMQYDEPQNVLCAKPSLHVINAAPWGNFRIHYSQQQLIRAVDLLLHCSRELEKNDAYQYDVVDFTRQVLLGELEKTYDDLVAAVRNKNIEKFQAAADRFMALAETEEKLLSTRSEFLLGRWLEAARKLGSTEEEKNLFEQNARMLITTWGYGRQHTVLHDYAHREWAGLIGSYYLPRWKIFFSDQLLLLKGKKPHPFDYDAFEETWTRQQDSFPVTPSGDGISMAREIISSLK